MCSREPSGSRKACTVTSAGISWATAGEDSASASTAIAVKMRGLMGCTRGLRRILAPFQLS